MLVSSSKNVFIVGADIFEFSGLFALPEAEVARFIAGQNAAFSGFEDLPLPIVTAINGFALGGGMEQALASDYRVMAATAQIGLPEVTLGIFPGYGGTVRLPRLAGLAVAIDWITSGKPRAADAALAAGVVDAVAAPEQLRATALDLLGRAIASGEWRARRERRHGPCALDQAALDAARKQLARSAALYPAPLAAAELMAGSAGLGRDAALALENQAFGRIGRTQAATSMVQQFVNDQFIKGKGKAYAKIARPLRQAGVLGAGIMGGGIAYTSAARGVPVVMKDIAQKALDLGIGEARKQLGKQVEAGRMQPARAEAVLASIRPTLDYDGFDAVDVVVEAVVEKLEVKKQVLADVERRVRADAIIASNTSSLPIGEIATALQRPENFVGMHFFNPVPVMPLVEVIRGARTSDVAAATVAGYAATMGKTPIVVQDCPGFLVNRILTAYLLGHLRALHDGADYLAVDTVMEKFGWPMGPAYLQDVIGMDTMKHVVEIIAAGYQDRYLLDFPLATMLLADRNRLGQKNGVGFYRYETDPKGKPKKLVDAQTAQLLATLQPQGQREFGEAPDHRAPDAAHDGRGGNLPGAGRRRVGGRDRHRAGARPRLSALRRRTAQVRRLARAGAGGPALRRVRGGEPAVPRDRAHARDGRGRRALLPGCGCRLRQQFDRHRRRLAAADAQRRRRRGAPPRCCSAWISVVMMRAPVAPIGWPSAQAPPLTLTRAVVELEIAHRGHGDHREGLVDLVQVDIACSCQPSRASTFCDGADRRGREPLRLLRVAGVADEARQRLEARALGRGAAHQHQRRGAVGDRGRAGRGDRAVLAERRLEARDLRDVAGAGRLVARYERLALAALRRSPA